MNQVRNDVQNQKHDDEVRILRRFPMRHMLTLDILHDHLAQTEYDDASDHLHFQDYFLVVENTGILQHVHIIQFLDALIVQLIGRDVAVYASLDPGRCVLWLHDILLLQIHLPVCVVVVLLGESEGEADAVNLYYLLPINYPPPRRRLRLMTPLVEVKRYLLNDVVCKEA